MQLENANTTKNFFQSHLTDVIIIFFNVYLFLREREHMSWGEAERERDRKSQVGSKLRTVSTKPNNGLEPVNCEIMT